MKEGIKKKKKRRKEKRKKKGKEGGTEEGRGEVEKRKYLKMVPMNGMLALLLLLISY